MSVAAYNGGEGRARARVQAERRPELLDRQRLQPVPGETKDYVPMVIAAAWIFLHPQQYGVEFPKSARSRPRCAWPVHHHLRTDICLGSHGTRDGYARAAQPQPAL
jgi:membrane-bound lytic murein transglycosylase D